MEQFFSVIPSSHPDTDQVLSVPNSDVDIDLDLDLDTSPTVIPSSNPDADHYSNDSSSASEDDSQTIIR